ncbi:protein strawberry notch homolog 1-like [Sinocyclocheilus grahami]|uniref:protein strawberry notch homolog 1-like n=1 Tax=Sinocyclocheilus grahami TaxID=75366 RepID=UPI0007AC9946|nr:PREDICTED: protein strawberry notch homolog 1-like [Sinocyclocheilus grahami]
MYIFFADLGSGDEKVKKVDVKKFLTPGYSTSGHVELYTVSVERGMSWEDATHIWADQNGPDDGFYVQVRNNKKISILVKEVNPRKRLFMVYRPNIGKQVKLETYADIKKRSKKVLHYCSFIKVFGLSLGSNLPAMNLFNQPVRVQRGLIAKAAIESELCASGNSTERGETGRYLIINCRNSFSFFFSGLIIPTNCVSPLINILSSSDQSQQLAVQQQQMWQQLHPQSISHTVNT